MEIPLKYGFNPNQSVARVIVDEPVSPLRLLNGNPGAINMLDALGAWQLVQELKDATGLPAAASFKHVSPAGTAVAGSLPESFRKSQMIPETDLSPLATAYARARGADRMSSFGDCAALSDEADVDVAKLLAREVSDAIIAPGYDSEALDILKQKKGGNYVILEIDPSYEPPDMESRDLFGFTLEQTRNKAKVTPELLENIVSDNTELPEEAAQSLIVATVALKYTQSNSVCIAYQGQVIGMGAGQQSRVHCTRLACDKADKWMLQQHPRVLALPYDEGAGRPEKTNVVDSFLLWDKLSEPEKDAALSHLIAEPKPLSEQERSDWMKEFEGTVMSSDAFFPFRDSIDRAARSNIQYVMQPGGATRDELVTEAANEYGMVMIHSGMRWFLH
ncbi:MAG: phosphoribosylaminoimidazolecarboxamide formyltransferase [Candidatus Brocadiia bacterium]